MVRMVALHAQAERGYGKEFDADPMLARTLKAIKWAKDAPAREVEPSMLDNLRRQYLTAAGSAADKRWGASRLKNEISRRYQRRDMVAES